MIIPTGQEFTPIDKGATIQVVRGKIKRPDDDAELLQAFRWLCQRLGRDPDNSEDTDTISIRSAVKAMVVWRGVFVDDANA